MILDGECQNAFKNPIMSREKLPLHTAHCKTLLYRPLYEFAASGGKLWSSLAKNLVSFLAWVKVGSLQDIAVNDEERKPLKNAIYSTKTGVK